MTKTRVFALISFLLLLFVCTLALLDHFRVHDRNFSVKEVRELTSSRGESKIVVFRGVVTLWQDLYFVVQDSTGGIRVRRSLYPKYSLYGHLVEVTGRTPLGPGEDAIIEASYVDLGQSKFPEARVVTAEDLQSSSLDGQLVTLRGITCPGHFDGEDEILFHTRLDGAVAQVRVKIIDESSARSVFANSDVEFTGVASTALDVDDKVTSFLLFVPDTRLVSVKSAPLDFRSLPVRTVAEMQSAGKSLSSLPFHLRGALSETPDRQGLQLSDSTGSIPLRVVDGSGYSEADVDIVGFLDHQGKDPVLDEALVLGTNNTAKSGQILTTAESVRRLPPDQARLEKHVQLEAVVTYNDPIERIAFVKDKTAGLFVWSNDLDSKLLPGDEINLSGITGPGDFAPMVIPKSIDVVRRGTPLPKPSQYSDEDIFAGRADSQSIELDGIVRDNKLDSGQRSLLIAHNGYRFRVLFPGNHQLSGSFINARVRVRGACGSIFNSTRQLLGIQIYAQSLDQLTVLAPSPYSAFDGPVTPIARLATFAANENAGYRLHLHGTVLAAGTTGPTWVRDATGAVLIREHPPLPLAPGDVERRCDYGNQHHRAVQRGGISERGKCAEDAVAADHRNLDLLAARQLHDKGDNTAMRRISALERIFDLDQHELLRHVDGSQVRADQCGISMWSSRTARRWLSSADPGPARRRSPNSFCASTIDKGERCASGERTCDASPHRACGGISGSSRRIHSSSERAFETTSASPGRTPRTPRFDAPASWPTRGSSSSVSRSASTLPSAKAALRSRAGRGSGSPSPARFFRIRPSSSSTRPRAPSTR